MNIIEKRRGEKIEDFMARMWNHPFCGQYVIKGTFREDAFKKVTILIIPE